MAEELKVVQKCGVCSEELGGPRTRGHGIVVVSALFNDCVLKMQWRVHDSHEIRILLIIVIVRGRYVIRSPQKRLCEEPCGLDWSSLFMAEH